MADEYDLDASGLLDGLDGAARAERAELLSWLLDEGITVEQIRNVFMPMLLPARRVLGDDGTYVSARETSEKTGLDLDLLQRIQHAMGLPTVDDPDAAVYLRADAEAATFAQRFIEMGIEPDQIVQITRLLADGLSRAAETMRYAGLASVLDPSASELVIAKNTEALMRAADPLLGPMIQEMLRLQLRHLMETEAISASERAEGQRLPGARLVTIAFADLVGFTRLGEVVPPEDLERLAHRLSDLAHEVSVPPVRFVKTIGDEVMLVSPDPVPLLEAVLTLSQQTEGDDDLPRLRVGLATGMAVSRAGDWFGGAVNLASRVTGAARPASVLASETTRDAIGDDERFTWSFAGARHLKGIKSDVKLFRVRRAGD
ncbi:adenylate/guanylate cyclase domain-containing protein [Mycobacterium sp. IDR2000157661]|uniref:adenylate/guanylate cyclase domain-containing protein n=1 Tax=Mycobacterium sp. IDR2000157661 TaxID=2867005 RepID=UPI001EEBDB59|nr:adenylate/guanylate cyclase domain-containing protein [Mycobacterium sp. IDR2000157661]ULE31539.1 adenylate/guanylate cyclase domain-containing protein [Mycobacterium sp. IDR2000157661]